MVDHVTPPANAEINIDIRHRNALRIQESLKKQIVLKRIDTRDTKTISDKRTGGRTATWPNGYILPNSVLYKIPNDEEISLVTHLLDNPDLTIKPVLIRQEVVFEVALRLHRQQHRLFSFLKALRDLLLEITDQIRTLRIDWYRVIWQDQVVFTNRQANIAHFSNPERIY